MLSGPFAVKLRLYAVLVDSYPLAVEGRIIIRSDLLIVRRYKYVIHLRAHRKIRVQHLCAALVGIRDIAHHVDLAPLEHLEKLRPAGAHVLVFPAGISCDLHLVLIRIARAPSLLVLCVERGLIPAHAHCLYCV